jgi:choline dehydrogenase-like flavoprotein
MAKRKDVRQNFITSVDFVRLGGCSSLNNMLYVRGDPNEYDNWEKNGCTGWSWKVRRKYCI